MEMMKKIMLFVVPFLLLMGFMRLFANGVTDGLIDRPFLPDSDEVMGMLQAFPDFGHELVDCWKQIQTNAMNFASIFTNNGSDNPYAQMIVFFMNADDVFAVVGYTFKLGFLFLSIPIRTVWWLLTCVWGFVVSV